MPSPTSDRASLLEDMPYERRAAEIDKHTTTKHKERLVADSDSVALEEARTRSQERRVAEV